MATPPSDVYALGVVAYQCLAGRRPFEGDNPLEIAMRHVRETPPPLPADIPPQVRAIVERAMAKDPAARWPTAAALAAVARQAEVALAQQAAAGADRPGLRRARLARRAAAGPRCRRRARAVRRLPARRLPGRGRPPSRRPGSRAPTGRRAGRPAGPAAGRPDGYRRGAAGGAVRPPPAGTRRRTSGRPRRHAGTRQPPVAGRGMVRLAILLAVLVLLCSGVISYNLRKQSPAGDRRAGAAHRDVRRADGRRARRSGRTSYRREVRLQPGGGGTTTSEGRQTR